MENHKQFSPFIHIAASKRFDETDERKYWDGVFTSTTTDMLHRNIPESEFTNIINGFTAGLRILDSHKNETQGIGESNHAEQQGAEIHGSFYVLKNLSLEGQSYPNTNDWIKAIDNFAKKLSMGWYSGRDICDISGESIYSYKCPYYPGERYLITDPQTGTEEMRTATYTCYDITPVELSLVYYPANPDARLIAKAKAMAASFTPEQIDRIEHQLKTAIVDTERTFFMPLDNEAQQQVAKIVADAIKPITEKVEGLETPAAPAAPQTAAAPGVIDAEQNYNITDSNGKVVRTMKGAEIPEPPKPITQEDVAQALQTAIAPLTDSINKIETSMKTGEGLDEREEAIAANLVEYNRINGKKGDEAAERKRLENHEAFPSIQSITALTESLKNTADALFGPGRSTPEVSDELDKASEGNKATPPSASNPW